MRPAFRSAFKRRHCLLPVDGFYEWKKLPDGKKKTPMHVRMKSREPFAFAGLWESWSSPDGSELRSCTIITTYPNKLMSSMHDRMPVILARDNYHAWLDDRERPVEELNAMLVPYAEMEAGPVSAFVNSPKNDGPGCVAPPARRAAGRSAAE